MKVCLNCPMDNFLPAMELNCVEKDVAARMKTLYNGNRKIIIGRVANTNGTA